MKLTLEHITKEKPLAWRHVQVLVAMEQVVARSGYGATLVSIEKALDYAKSENAIKLVLGQLKRLGLVERVTNLNGQAVRTQGRGVQAIYAFTAAAKTYGL